MFQRKEMGLKERERQKERDRGGDKGEGNWGVLSGMCGRWRGEEEGGIERRGVGKDRVG